MEVRSEAGARYFVTLQILTAEYLAYRKQEKRTGIMAIRRTLQRLIDLIQTHRDSVIALLHHGRYKAGLEGHISRTAMLAGVLRMQWAWIGAPSTRFVSIPFPHSPPLPIWRSGGPVQAAIKSKRSTNE